VTALGVPAQRRIRSVPPARAFLAAGGLLVAALLLLFVVSNVIASVAQRSLRDRFDRAIASGAAVTPQPGDPVADLLIPGIGLDVIVAQGPTSQRHAPVHLAQTALPGLPGLSVVEAGRLGYGSFFGSIDRLQIGDEIDVRTASGVVRYNVTDVSTVDPSSIDLSSNGDTAELLLIAPSSRLGGGLRLVVHAAVPSATTDPGSSQ